MTTHTEQKTRKQLTGIVVSAKMQGTVVVSVSRFVKHPKYGKFMKRVKRFHAQLNGQTVAEGDRVVIEECAPISKRTHFKVVEVQKTTVA